MISANHSYPVNVASTAIPPIAFHMDRYPVRNDTAHSPLDRIRTLYNHNRLAAEEIELKKTVGQKHLQSALCGGSNGICRHSVESTA